jgi:hypothetical protein
MNREVEREREREKDSILNMQATFTKYSGYDLLVGQIYGYWKEPLVKQHKSRFRNSAETRLKELSLTVQ